MRRLRLRWRLAVSHAALAILLVAFSGNRIQAQSRVATNATAVATAERDADVLATSASRVFTDTIQLTDIVDDQQGPSIQAEVTTASHRHIAGSDIANSGPAVNIVAKVATDGAPAVGFKTNDLVIAAAPIIVGAQTVGVAVVSERVPGDVPALVSFGVSSWLGILIIVFAAIAGWLLASILSRPIARLTDDVRQFALGADPPATGHHAMPEVDTLTAAIHGIAERGRRDRATDTDQRAALQSLSRRLSHQLRTPLTVLRLRLDALADPLLEPQRRAILVNVVADQIDQLDILGDELATLDPTRADLNLETIDLAVLVREIVQRNEPLASWGGVHIQMNGSMFKDTIVHADRRLLDDAVTNVVQNAVKYTPRGGRIDVSVECQAKEHTVTVSDTGPGIRASERAHVLRSGVRGSARGLAPGTGHGLGLAADALQRHGGRVDLDETRDGGTTVRLVLPTSALGPPRTESTN